MVFNFNTDKALDVLSRIKIPHLTLFIAYISSFNLWFLSIYFFNNELLKNHGLLITLLVTLALTTSWFMITALYMPKILILNALDYGEEITDEEINKNGLIINAHIFLEVIFIHSFFLYLEYLFVWSYSVLISVQFIFICVVYFAIQFYTLSAYEKKHKNGKSSNL